MISFPPSRCSWLLFDISLRFFVITFGGVCILLCPFFLTWRESVPFMVTVGYIQISRSSFTFSMSTGFDVFTSSAYRLDSHCDSNSGIYVNCVSHRYFCLLANGLDYLNWWFFICWFGHFQYLGLLCSRFQTTRNLRTRWSTVMWCRSPECVSWSWKKWSSARKESFWTFPQLRPFYRRPSWRCTPAPR